MPGDLPVPSANLGVRRVHLYVTGKVQGVRFRESMREKASELNLAGWVQNLPDGRVEAVAQGTSFAVGELVTWSRHGPATAQVRHVDVIEEGPADEELRPFEVRR